MNELPKDSALKDRLFIINVPSYKHHEKEQILSRFVIPKTLKNINQETGNIIVSKETAHYIIDKISNEDSGIRRIEQVTKDIVNKIHFIITNQDHAGNVPVIFNFGDKDGGIPLSQVHDIKEAHPDIPCFVYDDA